MAGLQFEPRTGSFQVKKDSKWLRVPSDPAGVDLYTQVRAEVLGQRGLTVLEGGSLCFLPRVGDEEEREPRAVHVTSLGLQRRNYHNRDWGRGQRRLQRIEAVASVGMKPWARTTSV